MCSCRYYVLRGYNRHDSGRIGRRGYINRDNVCLCQWCQPAKSPAISTFTGLRNKRRNLGVRSFRCTLCTVWGTMGATQNDQRNGSCSKVGNDSRDPSVARSNREDHPGLAREAIAPETRSRAVSVRKLRRFVVGLFIGGNRRPAPAHMPEQSADRTVLELSPNAV